MPNISMLGPNVPGFTDRDGNKYAPNSLGVFAIPAQYILEAQLAGLGIVQSRSHVVLAPIAAELITVKAAAAAANGAITIAAQPDVPRKLQVRQVIVTAITAGTLTLTGLDINGRVISEVISLIAAATQTLQTANAYAKLTAGVVAGLVGGGDGTLGIGVGTALALPTQVGLNTGAVSVFKAKVGTTDEAVGTVDTTANTIIPTTAADGAKNFTFWYLC